MKIDLFELQLSKSATRDFYMAGEELVGTLDLHVAEPVRIARLSLRVLGSVETAWFNPRPLALEAVEINDKELFRQGLSGSFEWRELILDEYKDLTSDFSMHCNESLEILHGRHQLRFTVRLPLDLVSSIDKPAHGWVRYACMAVLDVPEGGDSEIVAEAEFQVHSLLNLDAPHFREPTKRREEINIIGLCCRRSKGTISAELSVNEMGILPGETVTLELHVENTVKKSSLKRHPIDSVVEHHCGLVSLCQQLDFRSRRRIRKVEEDSSTYFIPYRRSKTASKSAFIYDEKSLTTAVHSLPICKANTSKSGADVRRLEFDIPSPLPPTSTKASGLITCSYFFRIDMGHFDLVLPVVIGSEKGEADERSVDG